jgi:F-type H+-transporting ATPase subunit b
MAEIVKETQKINENPTIFDSLGINLTSFIFYLICFAITFYLLYIYLFKPLLKLINDRNAQQHDLIEKESELSESLTGLKTQKEDLISSMYKEKNKAYEEGRQEGIEAKNIIIKNAETEALSIIESGRKEVETMKNNLKSDVEREVLEMWQNIITKNLRELKVDTTQQTSIMNNLLSTKI